jgi:dihydrofolate reductase
MVHKRKIVVYIATSADGFIAQSDGSVDWLDRPRPKGNYGMSAFYKSIDTILWGRKTHDMALDFQKKGVAGSGFDTTRLREKKGKDIWMIGGAAIVASFLDEGESDEFMIHIIPKFICEGISLIAARRRTVPLKLISSTKFTDGVVRLHYAVAK